MLTIKGTQYYKSEKILSYGKAIKLIKQFKKEKRKVGLCHGAFDILHPGHIRHFESAKKLCDVLFVSITKDLFVSERKGKSRPVYTDKLRAYTAASIEFVNYVVISDHKTAIEIIRILEPDFYIKGPDFINKKTPGIEAERKAIASAGGRLLCTNDSKFSTTELINYIKYSLEDDKVLIVIDRDGTIIKKVGFLGKDKDWRSRVALNQEIINIIHNLQARFNTTKVVVSNQSGVARGYFNRKTVENINSHIHKILEKNNIKIDAWKYCPDVDRKHVDSWNGKIKFDKNFIHEKTKRKPSPDLVFEALKELGKKLEDFKKIIVIGDSEDDKNLAINLNAEFIDANRKYFP